MSDDNVNHFKDFLDNVNQVDYRMPFRHILREALGIQNNSPYIFPITSQSDFAKGQKGKIKQFPNTAVEEEVQFPTTNQSNIPRLRKQANKTKAILDRYITENKLYTSGEYTVPSIKYDTLIKLRAIAPDENNLSGYQCD